MADRYLYFAFGSNLNTARMRARCPECRLIGPATLPGWRIAERLYADIKPAHGTVLGVLYGITGHDLARLDGYEGAPTVYYRKTVRVWYDGAEFRAFTYIMTPATVMARAGIPFPEKYREICAHGAAEHKLYIPEFQQQELFV